MRVALEYEVDPKMEARAVELDFSVFAWLFSMLRFNVGLDTQVGAAKKVLGLVEH